MVDSRPNNLIVHIVGERSSDSEAVSPFKAFDQKLEYFLSLRVVGQIALTSCPVEPGFFAIFQVVARPELVVKAYGFAVFVSIERLVADVPFHLAVGHRPQSDSVGDLAGGALEEWVQFHCGALILFGLQLRQKALFVEHVETVTLWKINTWMVI